MSDSIRGRLVSGRRKVKARSAKPKFADAAPALIVGEIVEPLPRRAARGTITLIVMSVFVAVIFYIVFAATVLAVFGAGGNKALVLRGAFSEGGAEKGTYVYASSGEAEHDLAGKLRQAFQGVPDGSVVEVIARPGNKVSNKDNEILVNGKLSGYSGQVKPRLLVRQYLAQCVDGACGPKGNLVLVPQGNVIGGVKGYVTRRGLQPVGQPVGQVNP